MITKSDIGRRFRFKSLNTIYEIVDVLTMEPDHLPGSYNVIVKSSSYSCTITTNNQIDDDQDFTWVPSGDEAPRKSTVKWLIEEKQKSLAEILPNSEKYHAGHTIIWNEANGERFRVCKNCKEEVYE